jgi:hypothetical protein
VEPDDIKQVQAEEGQQEKDGAAEELIFQR